jgi:integrase
MSAAQGGRRANGEGTVYQRKDGRWEASAYVPTATGGTRRVSVYGATRKEAVAKLADKVEATATFSPVDGVLLEQYLTEWVENVAAHRLRITTLKTYRSYLRSFIIPGLGHKVLPELTARDVREWLDEVRRQCQCCAQGWDAARNPAHRRREQRPRCCAGGKCCRKKVAHGTLLYLRAILSAALSHAVREDLIGRNVASAVQLGQPRPTPFEPLTAAEARKLMDAVRFNRWAVLFELALRTGLRRGELLGLRWSDLDLAAGTLTVVRTLQYTPEGMQALPTKTAGSQRRIILPAVCVASLTEHRRRQNVERRAAGPQWRNDHGFVFVTVEGRTVDPGSVNRNLHTACDIAGIRRIRFHDLRHSCATLLLEQGVQGSCPLILDT